MALPGSIRSRRRPVSAPRCEWANYGAGQNEREYAGGDWASEDYADWDRTGRGWAGGDWAAGGRKGLGRLPRTARERRRTVLWASVGVAAVTAVLIAVIASAQPSSQVTPEARC